MIGDRTAARGGFTLVEVLASLVLVALVLPTAVGGISLAMGLGRESRQRTEAAALARSKLAEAVATGDWREGRDDGDFGEDWPDYAWEMETDDWDEPGLSQVSVTVAWIVRSQERSATMTTLVYEEGE